MTIPCRSKINHLPERAGEHQPLRKRQEGPYMNLSDVINKFPSSPFLFIGSGMSRRYINLPDWEGLLQEMAKKISPDDFAYNYYKNKANSEDHKYGLMPKIADLIQRDFDDKWFTDPSVRSENEIVKKQVKQGVSPFKAEIANYIKSNTIINSEYQKEIDQLILVSEKSIAGVITTNYDSFLEDHFIDYKKYVGQNQLIFSAIQGVAEIYKIHGSVEEPDSLVINSSDYEEFDRKSAYLAAKLMTIFLEYPIIFMGYSINDPNIINIIRSIINCLSQEQLNKLHDRFIFVEYDKSAEQLDISPFTLMVDTCPLIMTKIKTANFLPIFEELSKRKSKLPVKLLRLFKQEIYSFAINSETTSKIQVAAFDDKRVSGDDLVLAIGKIDDLGKKGLSGITGDEWYRNIVLGDIACSADDLLECAFSTIRKQNSDIVPVHKLLKQATKSFPECISYAKTQTFNDIISKTIKNGRSSLNINCHSVADIQKYYKGNLEKITRYMAYLTEDEFDLQQLEQFLLDLFKDKNILPSSDQPTRTNIRRLIRIYDYLKWGK